MWTYFQYIFSKILVFECTKWYVKPKCLILILNFFPLREKKNLNDF